MTDRYNDIIDLPHYEPRHHRRMTMEARAAQFAPFAALNGHGDAINETARLTDRMIEPDGDDLVTLNRKMAILMSAASGHPEIEVTYFEPDPVKQGGHYLTCHGRLAKIIAIPPTIRLTDGTEIPIHAVLDINSPLFET